MRLVTYLSLVVRRVWAKRGILIGSLLGATLVTALLVIVPLYEDSVRAVDLLFTTRSAPAADVDFIAFSQTTSYSGATATTHRNLAGEQRVSLLADWYPTMIERSQSRELIVIPIDGSVDWLGQAEAWREELAAAVEAELPDEEVPLPPYPRPPQDATQVRFFTSPSIEDELTVVSGEWPDSLLGAPRNQGDPLAIVLGADLASTIRRGPGDRFILRPFTGLPEVFELVEVAGIVEPVDRDAKIWGIDDPGRQVYLAQEVFDAWTRALIIDPEQDPWLRPTRGFTNSNVTQRFILEFDADSLDLEEIDAASVAIGNYRAALSRETGGNLAANTFLPLLLDEFDVRSVVIGAPILSMLALVVGGALYFLIYTASLTLEREGPEIALLRTRGASSWQTVGIHLGQSTVIAIVAVLVAPWVARTLVGLTGLVPPLSDLTGGSSLTVEQVRSITPFLLAGGAVTFLSMGLAILPFARRRVLELRSLAARPTTSSVWQRYNLDLFAIALSLVILWQLGQRGFINLSGEEAELDPLAIVFPVLLLFTGALVLLRVLPWLLRLVGWIMARSRRMSLALPGWHLGRNPVPYGRLALLVWLTTGFGAFALTYANTLNASFDDRASFAAGSDVRIVDESAGLLDVPEGTASAAVLRTDGAPRLSSRRAEVIAIRPDAFASVVEWRSDFGGSDPVDVFRPLRPDGFAPDLGVELDPTATALRLEGVVVPFSLGEQARLGARVPDQSLRLFAKVFDARGQVWTMQADEDLVDSTWTAVEIDLTKGLNTTYPRDPVPPLSLHGLWVERSNAADGNILNGERLLIAGITLATPAGGAVITDDVSELTAINGLRTTSGVDAGVALRELYSALPEGRAAPSAAELSQSPLARDGTVTQWALPVGRSPLNPAVPQLRRIPDDLRVLLDRE
ncbi:MAG: hypothetical protein ACE5GC_05655, partial [Acidimicrobiia bacterium]